MSIRELLESIRARGIQLRRNGDELVVRGDQEALDSSLIHELRRHKAVLLEQLKGQQDESAEPSFTIVPEMLSLVELTAEEISAVAGAVVGGAANVQDIYPLAPLQEGILFHHLMGGEGDPYLLAAQFSFDSRARLDRYIEAVQSVIDRHDILRTAVVWEGLREPVQVVWRRALLPVEEVEPDPAQGDVADQLYARFNQRRFRIDVRQAPLLRLYIAHDSKNGRWLMMQLLHHLAGDHSTLEVMYDEIQAHLLGQAEQLPQPLPFRNLVGQARLGISREEHEDFFRRMLGDVEEPTAPFGLLDAQGDGSGIEEGLLELDADLAGRMRRQGRRLGVSAASICHLAWARVLSKVSGREDVVFGTVLFGRMQGGEGAGRVMGLFINTLPIRIEAGAEGAEAAVLRTHGLLADLMGHEHASLTLAQRCSGVPAPAPLFSALLNYRHIGAGSRASSVESKRAWEGIHVLRGEERTNYPFVLSVNDLGEGLSLSAQAPVPIGPMRVCEFMRTALESLVDALEKAPERAVRTLEVLPAAEREQVVNGWNANEAAYRSDRCVHELFEEQVEKRPDAMAVVDEQEELTYGELNRRANRLAHYLRELGVKPDDRVAICAERGIEMIVALVAVLKAGGAYLPMDPSYPADRLRYMLEDSRPVAVLTHGDLAELFRGADGAGHEPPVIELSDVKRWSGKSDQNPVPVHERVTPDQLAYVIYTSGSTGIPKGVLVTHRNVVRLVQNTNYVAFHPALTIGHLSNVAFDAATFEVWGAFLNGCRLAVIGRFDLLAPENLAWRLNHLNISVIFLTTALFNECIRSQPGMFQSLDLLLFGGEMCDLKCVSLALRQRPRHGVVHVYGPTETTTFASYFKIETVREGCTVPIGRPISNTRIYILDRHRMPVPIGVTGELYIGGSGVARGYLNQADLTAEKFLQDPFVEQAGARMYKTGDLGKWLADGSIEFLGRNDFQVKLRGHRIELGEIEARLAKHSGVREAVVVAREDTPGDKRLVAYYTTVEDGVTSEELRSHLSAKLPEYMVPAAYVRLESLPLTANGKLDRKGLPAPEGDAYALRGYEAPQGELETTLAQIWAEVLKLERVGRHDNFFALGGHSLLAVALMERVRRKGIEVDVRTLFAAPTLAALAAAVDPRAKTRTMDVPPNRIPLGCEAIVPEMLPLVELTAEEVAAVVSSVVGGAANVQDIYPLAPLQEGILFHHLMGGEGDPYLLAAQFSFDNRALLDRYIEAQQAVIDRHDILRTAVVWEGLGEPVQVVWRRAPLQVEEVEPDPAEGEISEQLNARFNLRRFRMDVRQAPLLRLYIAHDRKNQRWLMMQLLHHLAGDHSTLEVMYDEIQAHLLGEAEQLPQALPFRNLVAQAHLGVSREEHEEFFRGMLGDVEEPTAPFGLMDARGDGTRVEHAQIVLEENLAKRIRRQARRLEVSAASICHLAWAQVLGRASGREDVVFGTALFGRMHGGEGADRVMGLFINTLPVRIRVGEEGAEASVRRTHTLLSEVMHHEHASLALAQRCSRVPAPAPLFSAFLNYRHSGVAGQSSSDAARRAWEGIQVLHAEERTNYPFTISVDDLVEGFSLTAGVEASVGARCVCEYMRTALESLVDALETAPSQPVRTLEVLPATEREQVVYGWNQTKAAYPSDKCVHELFEEQAQKRPEAVALVFDGEELSYGELNRRANRLAHYLCELGVKPADRVAICVERGPEMIAGLLAVWKAGGAYVPLDPVYPVERLRYMLEDSAPVALLTQAKLAGLFRGLEQALAVIELDAPASAWSELPQIDPDRRSIGLTARHLAYIIYTSGSTGAPKGVMVEHHSLCNLATAQRLFYNIDPSSRVLQFASFSFDGFAYELVMVLCHGASWHLAPKGVVLAGDLLVRTVKEHRITHAPLPPAVLSELPEQADLDPVQILIVGGDRLTEKLAARWKNGRLLINAYGPTEATVCAVWHACHPEESGAPPIGKPIANARVYILDAQLQPAPVGVAGEIYIGGAGLARGYWNRPELTAERFLKDSFVDEAAARMYRTGDLGRWRADGNIEFLGRNDFQVKLRGFRIELGEIEARLTEYPGVREAVVVAREDTPGGKRLVAYYTTVEAGVSTEDLRAHLSAKLPEYMVPAAYVRLESMPLTANGKVDRRVLPAPEGDAFAVGVYEAPQGVMETRLAEIWADVLKVERVGRHDNFFALGGHSLLAVTVIERMHRIGMQVDARALFATPTVAELAAAVGPRETVVEVPQERIPWGCKAILPEMLPLVELTAEEIASVVGRVPGGAANVQDIYPLAPMQEGILFHHLMGKEGDPYLLAVQVSFDSRARLDGYIEALQAVIDRHDILRTAVVWEGLREPVQVVWRRAPLLVEELELDPAQGEVSEQLRARFNLRRFRIDVQQGALLRVYLNYDAKNARWLMMQLLHHLAGDHSTLEVLADEIQAHLLGQAEQLPQALQFRNLVALARLGISREEHEEFFRGMLGDVEELTAPFGLLDAQEDGSGIEEGFLELDGDLAGRMRRQARRLGVSTASLCHLAWARVLSKVCGREDVVFGTVLFGRMQGGEGADRVMGLFVNTLPIRIEAGAEGVEAVVLRTHGLLADLMGHEHASLALAQRCSGVPAPAPLFSSLLNYRHIQARSMEAWEGIEVLGGEERTNYPFVLSVNDLGERLSLSAQAPVRIGPMRVCEFMRRALESLVEALEEAPGKAVRTLEVLPAAEREQMVNGWNATEAAYPSDQCVHELFEKQVEKSPDAVAVVFEGEELSYGELNRRANRLAHYLRELGVKPDDRVAICVQRGIEMIVGLLAVLKAGGAYVPLDPAYPPERLKYMLEDSAPVALLTERDLAGVFQGVVKDVARIELSETTRWSRQSDGNPAALAVGLTPAHLAYVIYTSGSTGRPKGVAMPHGALVNLIWWQTAQSNRVSSSHTLQFAALGFDVAFQEIFSTLNAGGSVVLIAERKRLDSAELLRCVITRGIERLFLPFTALQNLAEELDSAADGFGRQGRLLEIITGGEQLRIEPKITRLFERLRPCRLMNQYGPTETHVVSSYVLPGDPADWPALPPIGKPIANTRIYILDGHRQPVPVGVAGEIYIGGEVVARGYWNRAELTAEKFLQDPFVDEAGARMYRTGDLGQWLADGNIEFLGRNDFQIKIRGFRIELGEIEARLAEHTGIRDAVVVAREERLVAYYTTVDEGVSAEVLRSHLAAKLPEYMVPAAYVRLESMPLTANGKLDRKGLPAPKGDAYVRRGYEAPQGEIETRLAEIWAEVLKLERVGRYDNFFELGGHSLLAVRAVSRMRQALGVEVAIRDIFAHPVLADLGRALQGAVHSELPAIMRAKRSERIPLSFAQQRLWFLAQMEGVSEAYHIPFGLGLKGDLERTALRQALDRIVGRHEVLRTVFAFTEGEPEQRIASREDSRFHLVEHDLRGRADAQELAALTELEAKASFDLERGPLIRGRLIRVADQEHVLLLTMHHIVSDEWSMGLLAKELSELYRAFLRGEGDPLPELEVQYADYTVWQREWIAGEVLQQQTDYWKKALSGVPAVLEIPGDRARPAMQDFTGGFLELELDEKVTAGLKELSRRQGTTLYMTLLAGWSALLSRLTGQEDVVIGTPSANRGRREIEELIGFFVNTLAVRVDLSGGPTVGELLGRVKGQALAAQQHQDIPFEQVVELLQPVRSLSHNPLFQVMFAWQSASSDGLEMPGLEIRPVPPPPYRIAKFDLTLFLQEAGDKIVGGLEYAAALFERGTVERYAGYFRRLLEGMVADGEQQVERLPMLSEREREQVVNGWNATKVAYPSDQCVHELFEEQVEKRPEAVAVVFEGEELSYGELNRRANRLAHHLSGLGVKPDDRVAICVERGIEMMVGLLGVLKAGGAYVPLDPAYPAERLRYMLEDSAPVALLTQSELAGLFQGVGNGLTVIELDAAAPAWQDQPQTNIDAAHIGLTAQHLAYMIYTSGSTGQPKGVMVEHRSLTNLVCWHLDAFGLEHGEQSSSVAGFGFDAATWETWPVLCCGAMLALPSSAQCRDPQALLGWWGSQDLDISFLPTPLAELAFARNCVNPQLRTLLIGGDQLTKAPLHTPSLRVINNYGPTEATVVATSGKLETSSTAVPPIGKPIANTQIYILDAQKQPVPVGVSGELYIGGAGVARGYWNRPELTAEKFLTDPFAEEAAARMYRTGDLGKWLADGNIEFLGRKDFQVKIRGYRIELGEIEAKLAECPGVREAAVVAREDSPGDKRLVAYYTTAQEEEPVSAEALRSHLSVTLPDYMVPAAYVWLESLPLTANGKLDRKGLPAPEGRAYIRRGYEAPQGETETRLAEIWAELLKVDRVGRHDNFFALGGHSFLAIRAVSRVRQVLGVEVAIQDIFVHAELCSLAAEIVDIQLAEFSATDIEQLVNLIRT